MMDREDSAIGKEATSANQGSADGLAPRPAPGPHKLHLPSQHHQQLSVGRQSTSTTFFPQPGPLRPSPSLSISHNPAIPPSKQNPRGLLHSVSASSSPAPSTTTSPYASRETSPIRKDNRISASAHVASQPSTAIQRALSASSIPQLSHISQGSDGISRRPQAHRGVAGKSSESILHWPLPPRLKSPPPATSSPRTNTFGARVGLNTMESSAASLNAAAHVATSNDGESARKPEVTLQTTVKGGSRAPSSKGMLETVQENSLDGADASPTQLNSAVESQPQNVSMDDPPSAIKRSTSELERPIESGSESAGNRSDHKRGRRQSSDPRGISGTQGSRTTSKGHYSALTTAKARQAEGKHGMTVETETVPSIPQSALNPGDRRNDNGGSIRLRPSNETIRPKKERRKINSKPRSITQGTGKPICFRDQTRIDHHSASSKADIFEARVASAVDAHSSDSDNTFVYESNPPEPQGARRHHSRTPSVTSAHSIADQRNTARTFTEAEERKVAGKRSMKFSNYHDADHGDSKSSTLRSNRQRRLRSDRESNHPSMLDHDSLFTQASKLRNMTSHPVSPRSPQMLQSNNPSALLANKSEQAFDLDGAAADDERTPLIASGARSLRNNRSRRTHDGLTSIDIDYNQERESHKRLRGMVRGFCLGIGVLFGAVVFAVAILVLWNRPLYDVKIKQIENVLATEQEIIFDLCVGAVNPNMLSVSISDMDLNVFAKSKHVGKSSDFVQISEKRRSGTSRTRFGKSVLSIELGANKNGVDHGTDPPDKGDLEPDSQTMLLGRVFQFDQALSFENTLFTRKRTYALGELTLMKPGNKTETGGSARWERVLQFPFELIVRGTLKYKLPISMKSESVAVDGNIIVHPEEGTDSSGNMILEPVHRDKNWE